MLKNPRKWRFTWETQSHSPTLRLFLFDSLSKPSSDCKNLNALLDLSRSQLLVSWFQGEDTEEVSLRVPIPRVLIDAESPLSFQALEDHIEVKLVLLLPVDHPIVSGFDSILNLSGDGDNGVLDATDSLKMESDLKSLSSVEGGLHFYCRNCSTKLTESPLKNFVEMPSLDWQEAADNWFGGCCCSFGGIGEKLVTKYANSYKCASGVCYVNFTSVILSKDDLLESKVYNWAQDYHAEPDSDEVNSACLMEKGSSCNNHMEKVDDVNENLTIMHFKDNGLATDVQNASEESRGMLGSSPVPVEEGALLPHCCPHSTDHSYEAGQPDAPLTIPAENKTKLLPDQRLFLNGFLGTAFMARSSNLSASIDWIEFLCPQCLSLLGAYPSSNGHTPVDDAVRLFKCYISTSSPAKGTNDIFRKYILERMFTNQLLESAKDELSFRTLVRDLKTKSPLLQLVLLNPDSWCCSGYCLDTGSTGPVMKPNMLPVIKVLFSPCSNSSESELRTLEDWVKRNQADTVFMFAHQVEELSESLALMKDIRPPSCNSLQGLPLSSLQR